MSEATYHLAQINLARAKTPIDDPNMSDFVAQLEEINGLADESPGFVWRLTDASGGAATGVRVLDDDQILVNMSVWESMETLLEFSYRGRHKDILRSRAKWFEPGSTRLVCWWVPAGHRPSVEEALEKLEELDAHGPSPRAFSFREAFPPPS